MATERDPYRVLGLSSAASQAEITSAYRRLLREHQQRAQHQHTKRRTKSDGSVHV